MPLLGPGALHTALARLPLNMGNTPWHPDTALRPASPPLATPGQSHSSQWRPPVLVLAGGSQWPPGSLTSAQLAQCKDRARWQSWDLLPMHRRKLCPSDSDTVALRALTPFPATHTGSASGPAGVRLTLVLVLTVVLELT